MARHYRTTKAAGAGPGEHSRDLRLTQTGIDAVMTPGCNTSNCPVSVTK
ncbi:MAG: hypothetical protein OXP08_05060 [bacterium]|nr:hypothetical protein [bacterium]